MKKLFTLVAVVFVTAIVLPSCKKDWTCVCSDGNGGTYEMKISNSRKPEAKLACEQLTWGTSCELQ